MHILQLGEFSTYVVQCGRIFSGTSLHRTILIQWFSNNQLNFTMTQHASLIIYFYQVFQHLQDFPESIPHSQISLWTKRKFTDGIRSWRTGQWRTKQMRMQLEVLDELVEIRDLGNLAKFLNCLKNTVLWRLKELGYRTTRPPCPWKAANCKMFS